MQDAHGSHLATRNPAHDVRSATQPLVHHGNTKAAWTGSIISLIGFAIGTVGFLLDINWVLVWVGAAIVVISGIVGLVMRNMGMGAKEN